MPASGALNLRVYGDQIEFALYFERLLSNVVDWVSFAGGSKENTL
jgi:hypothetical protein